jgi:hypothetical protein
MTGVFSPEAFSYLFSDNGPIELLAVLFTIIAVTFFVWAYIRQRPRSTFWYLLFSALVIFGLNGVMYIGLEIYFIGLPLLLFIVKGLHRHLVRLKIPIPSPATAFLTLYNYLLFTYCLEGFVNHQVDLVHGSINYRELFETGSRLAVMFFAFECWSRGITWLEGIAEMS